MYLLRDQIQLCVAGLGVIWGCWVLIHEILRVLGFIISRSVVELYFCGPVLSSFT
jgi:hypothetical protein